MCALRCKEHSPRYSTTLCKTSRAGAEGSWCQGKGTGRHCSPKTPVSKPPSRHGHWLFAQFQSLQTKSHYESSNQLLTHKPFLYLNWAESGAERPFWKKNLPHISGFQEMYNLVLFPILRHFAFY